MPHTLLKAGLLLEFQPESLLGIDGAADQEIAQVVMGGKKRRRRGSTHLFPHNFPQNEGIQEKVLIVDNVACGLYRIQKELSAYKKNDVIGDDKRRFESEPDGTMSSKDSPSNFVEKPVDPHVKAISFSTPPTPLREEKQKNRFNPSFPSHVYEYMQRSGIQEKILIADNETYGLYGKQSELSAYKTV
ncbi:hypothetical protein CEXT_243491 [Caerostris extrusa]|uniref:Uncharacterized protein n=1 Tax=Caerostris extrusa TaxID=172846 RepID=A0AAV4U199_CAEEX|nr:hypothetical protein CEXT_243491 [Caerostris extrusa]